MVLATAFATLRLAHRARVLRRLLTRVGPMALAALGGGAFAKFVAQARWPRMSVSLEDAASVTMPQVFELIRYVEQSDPRVLQQVMEGLTHDTATMTAVGASVAAIALRRLSNRGVLNAPLA